MKTRVLAAKHKILQSKGTNQVETIQNDEIKTQTITNEQNSQSQHRQPKNKYLDQNQQLNRLDLDSKVKPKMTKIQYKIGINSDYKLSPKNSLPNAINTQRSLRKSFSNPHLIDSKKIKETSYNTLAKLSSVQSCTNIFSLKNTNFKITASSKIQKIDCVTPCESQQANIKNKYPPPKQLIVSSSQKQLQIAKGIIIEQAANQNAIYRQLRGQKTDSNIQEMKNNMNLKVNIPLYPSTANDIKPQSYRVQQTKINAKTCNEIIAQSQHAALTPKNRPSKTKQPNNFLIPKCNSAQRTVSRQIKSPKGIQKLNSSDQKKHSQQVNDLEQQSIAKQSQPHKLIQQKQIKNITNKQQYLTGTQKAIVFNDEQSQDEVNTVKINSARTSLFKRALITQQTNKERVDHKNVNKEGNSSNTTNIEYNTKQISSQIIITPQISDCSRDQSFQKLKTKICNSQSGRNNLVGKVMTSKNKQEKAQIRSLSFEKDDNINQKDIKHEKSIECSKPSNLDIFQEVQGISLKDQKQSTQRSEKSCSSSLFSEDIGIDVVENNRSPSKKQLLNSIFEQQLRKFGPASGTNSACRQHQNQDQIQQKDYLKVVQNEDKYVNDSMVSEYMLSEEDQNNIGSKVNLVLELSLRFENMKEIQSNIFYLNTNLRFIDLRNNRLTMIPEEICSLKFLMSLKLDYNYLGQLPQNLNKLTNLSTLTISQNRLYQLPQTLFSLVQLEVLHLNDNKLEHIQAEICQLSKLSSLLLHNNCLEYLPTSLHSLARLEEFSCEWFQYIDLRKQATKIQTGEQGCLIIKQLQLLCALTEKCSNNVQTMPNNCQQISFTLYLMYVHKMDLLFFGVGDLIYDPKNRTIFHQLAQYGHLHLLKNLIMSLMSSEDNNGKMWDINQSDSDGVTPLLLTMKNKRIEMTKYLLTLPWTDPNLGCSKYGYPFHLAIQSHEFKLALKFANSQFNTYTPVDMHMLNGEGNNVLHTLFLNFSANSRLAAQITTILTEKGIEINHQNNNKITPLYLAVMSNQVEAVSHAIKHNQQIRSAQQTQHDPTTSIKQQYFDFNIQCGELKWNILHLVVQSGNIRMIDILMQSGEHLDFEALDISGKNAKQLAPFNSPFYKIMIQFEKKITNQTNHNNSDENSLKIYNTDINHTYISMRQQNNNVSINQKAQLQQRQKQNEILTTNQKDQRSMSASSAKQLVFHSKLTKNKVEQERSQSLSQHANYQIQTLGLYNTHKILNQNSGFANSLENQQNKFRFSKQEINHKDIRQTIRAQQPIQIEQYEINNYFGSNESQISIEAFINDYKIDQVINNNEQNQRIENLTQSQLPQVRSGVSSPELPSFCLSNQSLSRIEIQQKYNDVQDNQLSLSDKQQSQKDNKMALNNIQEYKIFQRGIQAAEIDKDGNVSEDEMVDIRDRTEIPKSFIGQMCSGNSPNDKYQLPNYNKDLTREQTMYVQSLVRQLTSFKHIQSAHHYSEQNFIQHQMRTRQIECNKCPKIVLDNTKLNDHHHDNSNNITNTENLTIIQMGQEDSQRDGRSWEKYQYFFNALVKQRSLQNFDNQHRLFQKQNILFLQTKIQSQTQLSFLIDSAYYFSFVHDEQYLIELVKNLKKQHSQQPSIKQSILQQFLQYEVTNSLALVQLNKCHSQAILARYNKKQQSEPLTPLLAQTSASSQSYQNSTVIQNSPALRAQLIKTPQLQKRNDNTQIYATLESEQANNNQVSHFNYNQSLFKQNSNNSYCLQNRPNINDKLTKNRNQGQLNVDYYNSQTQDQDGSERVASFINTYQDQKDIQNSSQESGLYCSSVDTFKAVFSKFNKAQLKSQKHNGNNKNQFYSYDRYMTIKDGGKSSSILEPQNMKQRQFNNTQSMSSADKKNNIMVIQSNDKQAKSISDKQNGYKNVQMKPQITKETNYQCYLKQQDSPRKQLNPALNYIPLKSNTNQRRHQLERNDIPIQKHGPTQLINNKSINPDSINDIDKSCKQHHTIQRYLQRQNDMSQGVDIKQRQDEDPLFQMVRYSTPKASCIRKLGGGGGDTQKSLFKFN